MDLKQKTLKSKEAESSNSEDLKSSKGSGRDNNKFKKGIFITVGIGIAAFFLVAGVAFMRDKGETKTAEPSVVEATQEGGAIEGSDPGSVEEETVVSGSADDMPWLNASAGDSSDSAPVEETKPAGNKTEPPSKLTPGITDPSQNQYVKNYTNVDKDTFVKDLNGTKVPENYNIGDIKNVVDFVSYKKKRATTAAGVELYWLDATYKGRKAKIQVPFKIFKELDPVGVTVVDVEITYVPNDDPSKEPAEIATFFKVREDYKQVLEEQSNNSGGW